MIARNKTAPAVWLWAAVLLTVAKLWLTRGQPVYAIGMAGHDERLFLTLAENIFQGNWLGTYDQLTLAKGAFYSIWVAFVFWIGLPLNFAQQLAYAGACAAVVIACRPALRFHSARLGLYALLLWNPMTYEAPTLGRVLRQNIYTPLTLLIFAALIALYYRRDQPVRRQIGWACTLGLSISAFWMTREESVWVLPSILLLSIAILVVAFRTSSVAGWAAVRSGMIALTCFAIPILIVAAKNHAAYNWFGTVETKSAAFQDAYGAMMRVRVGPELTSVPVSRAAREAMYGVSPTFATLRPYLEGDVGRGWAEASTYVTHLPAEQREIGGGWLIWALRDAVAAAGYTHNAGEAIAFYRRMADEINQACDDGRLSAGPARSGFLPPLLAGQITEIGRTVGEFADFFVSFKGFGAFTPPSIGGDDVLTLFRDMTGEALSPSEDGTNLPLPNQHLMRERKLNALQSIGKFLRPVLLGLFCIAQLVVVVRLIQLIWQRQCTYPMILAAATWGACFAYLLINAIIQVTSFPLLAVSSFAPAYPLLLLFIFATLWDAAAAWLPANRNPKAPDEHKETKIRLASTPQIG